MTRRWQERRAVRMFVPLLLLAIALFFCVPAQADEQLWPNERQLVDLSAGEQRFSFSVTSNNMYTFQSFGGEGAYANLFMGSGGEMIASGEGFSFSARLIADRQYTLVVGGRSGSAAIEIMRDALGRSFGRAQELRDLDAGYDKVIARARDVHWYRFSPVASGQYLITTRSALDTLGMLLDQQGEMIASSEQDGDFRLQVQLDASKTYYLRVSMRGVETGRYHLRFLHAQTDALLPSQVLLDQTELHMQQGDRTTLNAGVEPSGALGEVVWTSSDPSIARVNDQGVVNAVSAGACEITALALGGVSAKCVVQVEQIHVASVALAMDQISLPIGEQQPITYEILPDRASDKRVQFESSDPGVFTVDASGNVKGIGVGEATLRIKSVEGGVQDQMMIRVTNQLPKHRALVMGEQRYLDRPVRVGSVNTTQGMADLLREQSFSGYGYDVTMRMDSTRSEAIRAIQTTFKDAQVGDVSLFYINCHGRYENGTAYLEFYDGSTLTARALEAELRKIPGTVVVLIDCCNSGSFIEPTQAATFNGQVLDAFAAKRAGAMAMSKYQVMCSSGAAQDSYRYGFGASQDESSMSTVFARSLCEAGGWDLITDRRASMRGDANKNQVVTLNEAYQYTYRRVKYYLDLGGRADEQDVQVYPKGSQFALFSRQQASQ